ncbi:MAG TPA: ATP-binding cassette domain-containing protein [Candidatus Omnitrophota bacterium]|nr:ATP-binding cassette domain-containing protein [Candidatus Omnitrophota bacterium]HPT39932.1 ATP-binding cassette domain-containing protein [Candidatus Omnitrophota bacterium]
MALISLQEINLAFSGPLIFDGLSLQLEPGERIALLGRNGAGKTTLMKVMTGQQPVDSGNVITQKGIQVAHLPQEVPVDITGSVYDIVLSGLGARAELLSQHHHLTHRLQTEQTPALLKQLDALQDKLNHTDSWDVNNQVEEVIAKMKLDPESDFSKLSGGQKRRTLLARALVLKPEVLLLDEPTNHLDIDSMLWLEGFLLNYSGTVFFVTHDRMFMTRLATRIIELDRGKIYSWPCDYKTFLERKQAALDIDEAHWGHFDKKLAEEEVWIRKGVKARRCRNEGRVKALERLREEKKTQRKAIGQVTMRAQKVDPSGHRVAKISQLGFGYGEKCIVKDLTTQIMRGDKIGVIGPNGSGKTTLLNLLLGKLEPQRGKVTLGTNLQIAYYDQLRMQLDEEATVAENVNGESDTIIINGKPKHIIGYLQEFLFTPDRARTPIKVLSGGERNRLFLARLFSKPSNVLVMDEPTNDLDIETLELLEELLLEYPGTLILVSHDRAFLNNVVTSTMVLEGDGVINEYVGGYDDWLSQRKPDAPAPAKAKPVKEIVRVKKPIVPRKLNSKEQRELDNMEATIEKIEAEQKEIYALLADFKFYEKDPAEIAKTKARSEFLSNELEKTYARWEYLEELSA